MMKLLVPAVAILLLALPAAAGSGCGVTVCAGSPSLSGGGGAPVSVLLDKCDKDVNACFWPVRSAIDAGACKPPPPYVVDGYLREDGIKATLDWLRARPEWSGKPSSEALKEAVKSLWPCG